MKFLLLITIVSCLKEQFKNLERIPFNSKKKSLSKNSLDFSQNSFFENKYDLQDYMGHQYLGKIYVGSENQKMKILFDTGSSLIWINSTDCIQSKCQEHHQFDYEKSNSFQDQEDELSLAFKAGIVQGIKSSDRFSFKNFQISNQQFYRIEKYTNDFLQGFDGIIGLSLSGLAQDQGQTFLENLLEQNLLEQNVFTFFIDKNELEKPYITFGSINHKQYIGDITYVPVISDKYWQIEIQQILVNDEDIGICKDCKAIIDSGTSLISGPPEDVRVLKEILKIEQDCSNLTSLQSLTFVIDNFKFTLESEDYIIALDKENHMANCLTGIYEMNLEEPQGPSWILGTIFMSKFFVVFDFENERIGLAQKNNDKNFFQLNFNTCIKLFMMCVCFFRRNSVYSYQNMCPKFTRNQNNFLCFSNGDDCGSRNLLRKGRC